MESKIADLGGRISSALLGAKLDVVELQLEREKALNINQNQNIFEVSYGSGLAIIQESLAGALAARGVRVVKKAPTKVHVLLAVEPVPGKKGRPIKGIALVAELKVIDANGNTFELPRHVIPDVAVTDLGEIARALGIPFEIDLVKPRPVGVSVVSGFLAPNQVITNNNIIRAMEGGAFGVQVLVNGEPIQAERVKGLIVLPLTKDNKFTVNLINDSDFEVGVQLTIDGIDSFHFTEKKSALWLVPPRSMLPVGGWQLNLQNAAKFQVVPFKQAVAAELGQIGRVGVLSATFRRAYKEGEVIPDADKVASVKRVAIGRGQRFRNPITFVDRKFGKARATVPVRYDHPMP